MLPFFYSIRPLLVDGFGYGDASKPAFDEQAKAVGKDFVTAVENLLATGHVLTPVGHLKNGEVVHDDGCGDGRPVCAITEGQVVHHCSLSRPKVFGGGVTMSMAMRIGLGVASGEALIDSFARGMEVLESGGVDYGAHTDDHAHGVNSGCGAIDNAPLVLRNIQKYRHDIAGTIAAAGFGFSETDIEAVLDNFSLYATGSYDHDYSGQKIVQAIAERGKVVKRLNGSHRELFVLLNDVSGMTANQSIIRDVTGGMAQLFCVDIWRLKELARALYGDADYDRALISELVFTLGVAATLTHGDLPVYYAALREDRMPIEQQLVTV